MRQNLIGFLIGTVLMGTVMALVASGAWAQATGPFGMAQPDKKQPIEVSSDQLSVTEDANTAIFTGNVVIGQGEMRLYAPRVTVIYLEDQSGIEKMFATGGVTLISGTDAAEGREANYIVSTGQIEMTGDVLLTREKNAVTGDKLYVDTRAGTARVTGRVKTLLQPKKK